MTLGGNIYRKENDEFNLIYEEVFGDEYDSLEIGKDTNGSLWVGSYYHGVAVKRDDWQFYHNTSGTVGGKYVREVYDFLNTVGGSAYISYAKTVDNSATYELIEVRSDGSTIKYELSEALVDAVSINGRVYLLSYEQIYYLDNGAIVEDDQSPNGYFRSFGIDADNSLIVFGYNSIEQDGYYIKDEAAEYEFVKIPDDFWWVRDAGADGMGRKIFLSGDDILVQERGNFYVINEEAGLRDNDYPHGITVARNGDVYVHYYRGYDLIHFESVVGNELKGKLFNDLNGDGKQNDEEPGVANHILKLSPSNTFAITNKNGEFLFSPSVGENTVSWKEKDFWQQGITPLSYTFTYPNEEPLPDFQIGIMWDAVHDVAASVSGSATRPGFDTYYWINVRNEGSESETPKVTFTYPKDFTLLKSSIEPTSENSGQLTWDLPTLPSLGYEYITLKFNIPASTPLNTELFSVIQVEDVAGEEDLGDNIDSLHQIVTGSFDPNDKLVREGILAERYVQIGSDLTYTIRFQNTGTDTAFTVKVKDVLDHNLDIASLEILSSSHPMTYFLNGHVLNFTFNNIELPDSVRDEPNSHGYTKYRIKNISTIEDGTDVLNSAAIYFDFNEPVITNITSNRYVINLPNTGPTAVEDDLIVKDLLYPNPSRGNFTIRNEYAAQFTKATLTSITGRQIETKPVDGNTIQLHATPGLYFLRLEGKTKSVVCKVVIVN
ncbi:DUF7619 domain-containing protein [Pseudochryseolinea flava]|uniref:Secretion system C-terminal sorting domain-containing protein n=1 Tax=Pseudochryseolinea flava TaxID=2059302 RepID=A0A364XXR4_9BACT|nr:T9SS type A sorting domain-containing protein [Pseudochryseolinea flava]RAV99087.1 hypothetical protein DQQ10_21060 [Pseudochryseolinea flava]